MAEAMQHWLLARATAWVWKVSSIRQDPRSAIVTSKDCMRSLTFNGSEDRERAVDDNVEGTCKWLLNSPEFSNWVKDHGILLIRGHPGCGKSTILKYALKQRRSCESRTGSVTGSFFFYRSGTEFQRRMQGLFRSLLRQLLDKDTYLQSISYKLCRKHFFVGENHNIRISWDNGRLESVFKELVTDCTSRRALTLLIDIVDECRMQDRDQLVQFFFSLQDI